MIRIAEIVKTCRSMPAQWEGRTTDDRVIYIRFRHGQLTVQVSDPGGILDDALDAFPILNERDWDDVYAGEMDDPEMRQRTASVIDWAPSDPISGKLR